MRKTVGAAFMVVGAALLLSPASHVALAQGACPSICSGGGTGGEGGSFVTIIVPGTSIEDQPVVVCLDCGNTVGIDTHLGNGNVRAGASVDIHGQVGQGNSTTVSGGGFAPNTRVNATLHSDPVFLGSTTTDALGNFSMTVIIPFGTPLGFHDIVVTGLAPNGTTRQLVFPITVVSTVAETVLFVQEFVPSSDVGPVSNGDNSTSDLVTDAEATSNAASDGGGPDGGFGGGNGGNGGGAGGGQGGGQGGAGGQ